MASITNIVVTVVQESPLALQINFDTDLVTNISDVNSVFVNFGPDSSYGTQSSGQPIANIPGGITLVAHISPASVPVHFQCEVTDFISGDVKSSDQTYPPPPPPPPDVFIPGLVRKAPNWQLSPDFVQQDLQIYTQKDRQSNSKDISGPQFR